jgi:hypothetical protein
MTARQILSQYKPTETDIPVEGGTLHIRALTRRQYRALLDAHPPAAGEEDADWNGDTFPPALIAATVVKPKFSEAQAQELWDDWEPSEAGRVFLACYHINETPSALSFILPGSVTTNGSGLNSTTASPEESPIQAS